jgi:hypothetical protein
MHHVCPTREANFRRIRRSAIFAIAEKFRIIALAWKAVSLYLDRQNPNTRGL